MLARAILFGHSGDFRLKFACTVIPITALGAYNNLISGFQLGRVGDGR